jgi:hypothetical protein
MINQKLNCKFSGYSWIVACVAGVSYCAVRALALEEPGDFNLESFVLVLISAFCVFFLPASLGTRLDKEAKFQTSYLVLYLFTVFTGEPMMNMCYLLISKTSVFFLSSQNQEMLPGNQKTGVISHILSHKDSRRIFLFLM